MTKHFKVGQVWADRDGDKWKILSVKRDSICAEEVGGYDRGSFYPDGKHYPGDIESRCDLITLIKDTEESL